MAGIKIFSGGSRPGLKAIVVAGLVLIMTVPLFFISMAASERQGRAEHVQQEVGYEWGGLEQTVAGPFLVVPFDRLSEVGVGEDRRMVVMRRYAVILPQELNLQVQAASQMLRRGIFHVPVYEADIMAEGRFPAIDPASIGEPSDDVRWDEAFITLSLSDTRGIRSPIRIELDGSEHTFLPGPQLAIFGDAGAHLNVPGVHGPSEFDLDDERETEHRTDYGQEQPFRFSFLLNGSSRLRFVPLGQSTTTEITSDWTSPSYQGAFLPTDRGSDDEGFSARWTVPNLARSFPDQFVLSSSTSHRQARALGQAAFGVDFIVPLDHYQKIFRALRYAVIFIVFTFLAFFLVEIVLKTRLHAVQYLLIGAAQSVFYLLLLSASEHIGFGLSFGMAATATVALITTYGGFISRSRKVAAALLATLSLIYFILYTLLQVEDFALLFGSIAIFAALALTMLVTRNVNWYGDGATEVTTSES